MEHCVLQCSAVQDSPAKKRKTDGRREDYRRQLYPSKPKDDPKQPREEEENLQPGEEIQRRLKCRAKPVVKLQTLTKKNTRSRKKKKNSWQNQVQVPVTVNTSVTDRKMNQNPVTVNELKKRFESIMIETRQDHD